MCIRNSQKYRGKQSKFPVWASNCFLPWETLSQPLWKRYSYVRGFLSFPMMWQRNVSFRNFLCLFPYFWNWIKNWPGSLTLLSVREFSSNRKFMMLSLPTFTIFNFLMAISLEVLFFEKNLVCFQKWSGLRIVPFPSVCRAWHEKWSRQTGLKFLVFGVPPCQNKNRNRSMD